jgi:putative FmdB family regulatory protein
MPRYVYKCQKCEIVFETTHSIKEKLTSCEKCEEDTLQRLPSVFSTISNNSLTSGEKPGDLVKNKIEEFKEDLIKEKEKYAKQEFKNDN